MQNEIWISFGISNIRKHAVITAVIFRVNLAGNAPVSLLVSLFIFVQPGDAHAMRDIARMYGVSGKIVFLHVIRAWTSLYTTGPSASLPRDSAPPLLFQFFMAASPAQHAPYILLLCMSVSSKFFRRRHGDLSSQVVFRPPTSDS